MTTSTIADAASLQRLHMMSEAMLRREAFYNNLAESCRASGAVHDAHDAQETASHAAWVAYRVRCFMATVSSESAAEASPQDGPADEPPRALFPFVAWLVLRIGRYLPWLPAETWRVIGVEMLRHRPPGGAR